MDELVRLLNTYCCCCFGSGEGEDQPLIGSSRPHHTRQFEKVVVDETGAPTDKRWYHGGITDAQADYRLRSVTPKDGTYLVYDNPTVKGEYVLLVSVGGKLHRWRISRRTSDNKFVLGINSQRARGYESVRKLIKYHRGVTGKPIMLEHGGRVVLNDYAYVDE